jgi:23S rRNA (adenine2030-N6)-methyltransferase
MPNPKGYNHGDKAGNAGDVWKHFILLAVIEAMLKNPRRSRKSPPFVYVDTHAATGIYSLRPSGPWQRGVGAIRSQVQQHPN